MGAEWRPLQPGRQRDTTRPYEQINSRSQLSGLFVEGCARHALHVDRCGPGAPAQAAQSARCWMAKTRRAAVHAPSTAILLTKRQPPRHWNMGVSDTGRKAERERECRQEKESGHREPIMFQRHSRGRNFRPVSRPNSFPTAQQETQRGGGAQQAGAVSSPPSTDSVARTCGAHRGAAWHGTSRMRRCVRGCPLSAMGGSDERGEGRQPNPARRLQWAAVGWRSRPRPSSQLRLALLWSVHAIDCHRRCLRVLLLSRCGNV